MFSIPRTRSRRLLKLLNLIIELAVELYLTTAARDLFDAIWNFPTIDLINSFCCWKSSVVTSLDESSRKIRSARWMSVTSIPRKEKMCKLFGTAHFLLYRTSVKPWPKRVASRHKLITWVFLRLRLAKPWVHLRALLKV